MYLEKLLSRLIQFKVSFSRRKINEKNLESQSKMVRDLPRFQSTVNHNYVYETKTGKWIKKSTKIYQILNFSNSSFVLIAVNGRLDFSADSVHELEFQTLAPNYEY